MRHDILSSIATVPVSYFIYSSFSFYGPKADWQIPGGWFVRAIGGLGRSTESIRMELFRMERDGELTSRKVGRAKIYSPTIAARAEIEAGMRKIFSKGPRPWNARWTIVQFHFDSGDRVKRDRLRSLLAVEGFASLGNGVFIHPRAPSRGLLDATESLKAPGIRVFIDARLADKETAAFAATTWPLDEIARAYRNFIRRFEPLETKSTIRLDVAFAARFALVFEYLAAAWADPELPLELLPRTWPGNRARLLAQSLYRKLLPLSLRYADEIAAQ